MRSEYLADGDVYLNRWNFTLLPDTQAPAIEKTGLMNNNGLAIQDIITSDPKFYLRPLHSRRRPLPEPGLPVPPYKIAFSLDGEDWTTVWEFPLPSPAATWPLKWTAFHLAPPTLRRLLLP